MANTAIFALLFPAVSRFKLFAMPVNNYWQYNIMAIHARPLPLDPYNPVRPKDNTSQMDEIILPSPYIPIRLPIFALVIWLNDVIVSSLTAFRGDHKSRHRRNQSSVGGKQSIEEGIQSNAYSTEKAAPKSPKKGYQRKYD